jgi:capsular polysaccharide transport system permease protein
MTRMAGPQTGPVSLRSWFANYRAFLLVVLASTLIVAAYYLLVAPDQYESEAHFSIRSNEPPAAASGPGQAASRAVVSKPSLIEAAAMSDYLRSHDAVAALRERAHLVERFRRPEADRLSRLDPPDPAPETLLKFYKRQVDVGFHRETGLIDLRVRAFRPEDATFIALQLLALGDERLNSRNQRSYVEALGASRQQVAEAEARLREAQIRLASFRQRHPNIDAPVADKAQTRVLSELKGQLAAGRAQLAMMGAVISRSAPQYVAMESRVRLLSQQVARQNAELTGVGGPPPASLADYQELQVREQIAIKQYEAAAASLEQAREQAGRQRLFIVHVVEPNLPVEPLYPKRMKIVLTVFGSLLLVYGIGWLVAAVFRKRAA